MPTILIVDDHVGIRKMLGTAFSNAGYRVATASDGSTAIELCRERQFDAVLSDIDMPHMTGCELARLVAARCPSTHVVLMSACELRCHECPYVPQCPFVPKPFRIRDLLDEIERAIARR